MFQFLIPAAASLISGAMQSRQVGKAQAAERERQDKALALQERMYEEGVQRQQPFLTGGTEDYNRLRSLMTGGPEAAQQFLQMDPGYGFRLSEGMKALERGAAARGGLLSGNMLRGAQRYGQDLASQEFGQAGFDAAVRLQEGIAAAQQQARDGILNAEAFNAEVQRQQELFNQELANIEEAEKARAKAADDRAKAEDDRQKALLKAQDDYRKQQETALQAYQQQQAKAQEEYAKEQQRIFEEQRKAAEAEAKRQEERLAKLNTLGAQSLSVADVRSTEGANLVLQLAAGAQDPRLIQERLQTKLLQVIANGITQAADNYFNTPVGIVGGSMTLNPNAQQNVRL